MIKVIIVEDEIQAKNALELMLLDYNIKILGHATGVNEAYELIKSIQPDVVFLDIELVDGSSFDLWILSPARVLIAPQAKASPQALERITSYIFYEFREGNIKEYVE